MSDEDISAELSVTKEGSDINLDLSLGAKGSGDNLSSTGSGVWGEGRQSSSRGLRKVRYSEKDLISLTSTPSQITLSPSPSQAYPDIEFDEIHILEVYSDGYILDGKPLVGFEDDSAKEFVAKVRAADPSLKMRGEVVRYDIITNEFPANERFDRPKQEYVYQIDSYPEYFTVNHGEKRLLENPYDRNLLRQIQLEKVPKEFIHKGYTTRIRHVEHKTNPTEHSTFNDNYPHHKHSYKDPKGEHLDIESLPKIEFVKDVRQTLNPFPMKDFDELPTIKYDVPSRIPFNPYNPKTWLNDRFFDSPPVLQEFLDKFIPMDVMKLRSHVKSDEILGVLSVLAHDLSSFDFDSFNFYAPKVLFILVNNYTDESLHLGSGPISDAVVAASFHRYLNYQVYFLHNPAPEVFAQWLQKILLYTTENLTIYYSGRRTEVFDYDDEKFTALNELLLFDNGYILDEDLRVLLKRYPKGKETKVLLVSDIYESGSVWFIPPSVEKAEIEYYSNIVSISTLHKDLDHVVPAEKIHYQGLFTFLLFASARFSGSLVPNEIQIYLAPLLSYYQLDVELYVTKKELREEPVLPFAQ